MSLSDLPPELLSQVTQYVQSADTLRSLTLTNRYFHDYVERDGWNTFVRNVFPSTQITPPNDTSPSFWKDAANGLTNRSRAWERKALAARHIEPRHHMIQLADGSHKLRPEGSRKSGSQTMGYMPVIDSYEVGTGSGWADRRETVAWGAGAELVIRVKTMGKLAQEEWEKTDKKKRLQKFDRFHSRINWMAVTLKGYLEGHHDITNLSLLRPHQKTTPGEEIIVGRARGPLTLLHASSNLEILSTKTVYDTEDRTVRSAHVNDAHEPLLAACFSDFDKEGHQIAIYPVHSESENTSPTSQISIKADRQFQRIRASQFLSDDRLVIGLSRSAKPIQVYHVAPDGIREEPLRVFKFGYPYPDIEYYEHNMGHLPLPILCSVYGIKPIPPSSHAGGNSRDIFLSACHDGIIRLYDMRVPGDHVSEWSDPVDSSPVYSLLILNRERFLAGSGRHSLLKIFDLRMPEDNVYSYKNARPHPKISFAKTTHKPQTSTKDWNAFIHSSISTSQSHLSRHELQSPIYSLSSPSPHSPTIYAGTEDFVTQIDVRSTIEKHPDPIFKYGEPGWYRQPDLISLAAYEQGSNILRQQYAPGTLSFSMDEWDERWARPASDIGRRS
ncbi:MAG: hypothetical protein M1834_003004 [Cirrosporium novae-zelandiae]|nr:MAG: hypothetical protein M1834_003004 [Cirrosporium novae-zelandiae]